MQQEDDFAYHFSMSPDSKTMIVLLEREVFNDDVYAMVWNTKSRIHNQLNQYLVIHHNWLVFDPS